MNANQSGIYEILNTVNGKRYIGSAVHFKNRWATHISLLRRDKHHSQHLQRAWNKYGKQAFEFNTLLICAKENLLDYEQRCLDGLKPEYNVALAAEAPMRGRKHSAGSRTKMSDSGKTRPPISSDTRAKLSKASTGRTVAPETRAKISAGNKGKRLGVKLPPEVRANISTSLLGNKRTLGYRHTEEALEKMGAASALRLSTPEARAARSAAAKAQWALPEARAKIVAAQCLRWQRIKETQGAVHA